MLKKIIQVQFSALSDVMIFLSNLRKIAIPVAFAVLLTACDPMLSIQGSFWPAWIICILAGLAVCMVLVWQLVRHRLVPYIGPPLLIVPSLWALCTFVIWLLFYST